MIKPAEAEKNLAALVDLVDLTSCLHQGDLGVMVNDPDEGHVTKHVWW